jgi:hypothetical protein
VPKPDLIDIAIGAAFAAFAFLWGAGPFTVSVCFFVFAARPLARAYWKAVSEADD